MRVGQVNLHYTPSKLDHPSMNQLQYWLYAYQQSLPADYYIIRLVDASGKRITQPRRYSHRQLIKSWKYLRYMNHQGYHVYGRPEGYEFIFIDDIPRKKLLDLVKLKPALAMESSPNNFQAFLHLQQLPDSRAHAASICRNVCSYLDADLGSAEPDHVGRLPGFCNLKPEHQKNGKYPLVILHHAMDQFTSCNYLNLVFMMRKGYMKRLLQVVKPGTGEKSMLNVPFTMLKRSISGD